MNLKQRKIIHIDMDCFYASIEIRENSSLCDKPVAVGGRAEQRGVLATCNYLARQFGLHSAMPTSQALKLCPDLVLLPVNMSFYKQVSQQIHEIFHRYTDLVEPLSLDEAYLDVTDCTRCSGSATWIAEDIRQAIWNELRLTASAGVAPLKFLAKIASEQRKPNGLFVIKPEDAENFIKGLSLSKIPGVGKVTTQRLLQLGLKTCADVQQYEQGLLVKHLGKVGQRIWLFSHGIDKREVQPHRERKSVGVEKTLEENITDFTQAVEVLNQLYPTLLQRINHSCPHIPLARFHKLGIKIKLADFQVMTLEKSLMELNQQNFVQLLQQLWQRVQGKAIRLVGLQVHLPESQEHKQMTLW